VFGKIIASLYDKVFINIVSQYTKTVLYIEVVGSKGVKSRVYKEFSHTQPFHDIVHFVQEYQRISPFSYVSFLDASDMQGALPTCDKERLSYYYDLSTSLVQCYENRWLYYTSKSDIEALKKSYETFGVDFVFSPFLLVHNFFQDKVGGDVGLYVLIEHHAISLTIFKENQLLFAKYLEVEHPGDVIHFEDEEGLNIEDEESLEDLDEGIDLEDIEIDDDEIETLEDFGDIEDLDSVEDIEDFAEHQDEQEELLEYEEMEVEQKVHDTTSEDYQRFSLIEKGVGTFYSDTRYESEFLENIYIADSVGVSADLRKYLEEEMFLNVYIRKIDIGAEICELAKEELQHAL